LDKLHNIFLFFITFCVDEKCGDVMYYCMLLESSGLTEVKTYYIARVNNASVTLNARICKVK